MLKSDAEQFLEDFPLVSKKVFVYKQEFLPDEYITIEKSIERNYKLTEECTIKEIPNLVDKVTGFVVKEELVKLLSSEQLKEYIKDKWYMNINDFKTGGCNMGCWATSNPDLHSPLCRKYIKW